MPITFELTCMNMKLNVSKGRNRKKIWRSIHKLTQLNSTSLMSYHRRRLTG